MATRTFVAKSIPIRIREYSTEKLTFLLQQKDKLRAEMEEVDTQIAVELANIDKVYLQFKGGGKLSPREEQILNLLHVRPFLSNKEIGKRINIAERTVKFHVSSILLKLNVATRYEV